MSEFTVTSTFDGTNTEFRVNGFIIATFEGEVFTLSTIDVHAIIRNALLATEELPPI